MEASARGRWSTFGRWRAGVRRSFAPGTPSSAAASPGGSGGLPADVDELAAILRRSNRAVGDLAAAGPDIEPNAQPAGRVHRRVTRRVDVPADVARANSSTPPRAGTAATWR